MADSTRKREHNRFAHPHLIISILVIMIAIGALFALSVGRYPISFDQVIGVLTTNLLRLPDQWDAVTENTVMNLRLPRIAAALLIGAALAESGAAYQGIFQNPMVSPDILGVSSGACVGAALGILLGFGSIGIQIVAFATALAAVLIAVSIPRLFHSRSILMLVLAGVIVSGLMTSILGLMKFLADPNGQLADIVFWTMGSLNSIHVESLEFCAPAIIICGFMMFLLRWRINIMSLPDAQAHYLGMDARRMRKLIIVCATLMTACAVCLSGTIGWIGLVVPHMSRLIVGGDNRFVIPTSILFGSLFMLAADTLARTLSTMSIPISIITGITGAPLFLALLAAQRKQSRW